MNDKSSWIGFDVVTNFRSYVHSDSPHVTLAYLGTELSNKNASAVLSEVTEWWMFYGSHMHRTFINVSGWDIFNNSIVALLHFPELIDHRSILVNHIEDYNIQVNKEYDFIPHITVAFKNELFNVPHFLNECRALPNPRVILTGLFVMHKGERVFNYNFLKEIEWSQPRRKTEQDGGPPNDAIGPDDSHGKLI